jgi:hypothetical protein
VRYGAFVSVQKRLTGLQKKDKIKPLSRKERAMERGVLNNRIHWAILKLNGSIRDLFDSVKSDEPQIQHIKKYFIVNTQINYSRADIFEKLSDEGFWATVERFAHLLCFWLEDEYVLFAYSDYMISEKKEFTKELLKQLHTVPEYTLGNLEIVDKVMQVRGHILSVKEGAYVVKFGDVCRTVESLNKIEVLDNALNRELLMELYAQFSNRQLIHGWDLDEKEFVFIENWKVVDKTRRAIDGISKRIMRAIYFQRIDQIKKVKDQREGAF